MATRVCHWLCYLLVAFIPLSYAQTEYHMRFSEKSPDLDLPVEPTDIGAVDTPRMALYKPAGDGPFPALVLLHQCGGLGQGRRPNLSMLDWAREALSRGYVVLQLDSLNPRGVDTLCQGPKNDVFQSRGVKDALQAAVHLRKQPYVDPKRVVFAGFSWGAGNGMMAASEKAARMVGVAERFRAMVSFYPPCVNYPKNSQPYTLVLSEIDTPLLVLLGGEDTETPPQECIDRLKPLKDGGAPVEWHLYPSATHCWDCRQLNGFSKNDAFRGVLVEYLYDEAVTRDSRSRMFEFFDKVFAREK